MISVFSFPDGSSLVNKVWNPSVSLSSLYRIDNNVHTINEAEFASILEQQMANAVGCYSIDCQTNDIIEHLVGCSGSFNLFLGLERITLCFTTERVSHVYMSSEFNSSHLHLLPQLDPSLLATDYYGLSRGIRPLSTLCFDDFKVSLYNDLGAGLDLKCNYILMQDEQEIGYFGAKLSGGTLNPIPVTAKGLRKYLISQRSRKIPIKSDFTGSNETENLGIVRTTAAATKAQEFFEDIRAGNLISTGSWMNLVYMPDKNFFSRPSASVVGVRACNSESMELADEIILEAKVDCTCFSKLMACISQALTNDKKLANTKVNMLVIVNANEFDSLVDKLRLQKEELKREVDEALTKLVRSAQDAIKLELDKPWTFSIDTTLQLPRGMPIVDYGVSLEQLAAENNLSRKYGSKKSVSFQVEMPSLSQCFSFPEINGTNRESALKKFGRLYDITVPDFTGSSSVTDLVNGVDGLISVANARPRVKETVESVIKDKIESAVSNKLKNIVSVLTFDRPGASEADFAKEYLNPTCNGAAAVSVGWMSKFRVGPFPGEWHVDVSMPDYALYKANNLEATGCSQSQSGGGLWRYAGPSSYKFPLKRFEEDFPIAKRFETEKSLEKVNAILSERGEHRPVSSLSAAFWVPSFLYDPRVSVVSAEKNKIQLELHFGYAGCPAPVLAPECTNLKSLNRKLLEDRLRDITDVIIKPAGSSFDYCVLDHLEDKTFAAQPLSWFDTRQRTVHVGYRKQIDVPHKVLRFKKDAFGKPVAVIEQTVRKEWAEPYAVSPYFFYDVIVPISVDLSDLDKEFAADSTKEEQITKMLNAVSEQAEFLANVANLKEIVNLMAQTNNYDELKLLGATEKSLLNPEMAACFTDLNISDSSKICEELASSLKDLYKNWGDVFKPGTPGAAKTDSDCYKNLEAMIKHLKAALAPFSCKNPPVFFSASQVGSATRIFDGGSVNLLLV